MLVKVFAHLNSESAFYIGAIFHYLVIALKVSHIIIKTFTEFSYILPYPKEDSSRNPGFLHSSFQQLFAACNDSYGSCIFEGIMN